MTSHRAHWPRVVIGLALLWVAAAAFWRFAGSVSTPNVTDTPAAVSPASASQVPPQAENLQLDGLPATQRDVPSTIVAPELQATPLLKGLTTALKSIQAEPDTAEKETKLDTAADEIAAADLPTALEFLKQHDASEASQALSLRLIRRWAESDPPSAAAWVSQTPVDSTRQEAVQAVAIAWANQDLSAAVEWVRQLPTAEEQQAGLFAVAYEAARTQPKEALKLAMDLPAGKPLDDLVTHAASQWAASAPEAAADWAAGITDATLRERVLSVIATAWGGSDPLAAATLAVKSLSPGRRQDDAVVGIVQRWVQNEPEPTAAWVAAFPEGELRHTALDNLVRLWADQDLQQAGLWLADLDLGESRDVAIGTYVSKLTPLSPEAAAQWAEHIGDDILRHQQLENVGEAWMESDAAAARAWIAQTPLQETTKARLLALKPQ